jgi:adenylate kinase family enzyme
MVRLQQQQQQQRVVFVTGCPEAGKSSVALALAREFGLAYCSPGDWLRLRRDEPTPLGEFITHNYTYERLDLLVTDYVAVKIKEALLLLPSGKGIVVDGFPR